MDHHEVREELCIPVDKPLIAVVVNKDVLVDVQVVLAAHHLNEDGVHRFDQRVLQRLVLPVVPDVAAVDGFGRWTG